MKKFNYLSLVLIFILASCATDPEPVETTTPPDPVDFTVTINPKTAVNTTGLSAILSIEKENGTSELIDLKVSLRNQSGLLITDKLSLAEGNHKITKLLIVDADNKVVLSTPQSFSAKATDGVQTLPFTFSRSNNTVTIESIAVNEIDLPEDFGYPTMTFGEHPYIKVKIKSSASVGTVEYHPLSQLKITSDKFTNTVLSATEAEVLLPKKYAEYKFEMNVWSKAATKTVATSSLKENPSVSLSISTAPRLLKSETVYTKVAIGSVITSRREYTYLTNNLLDKVYYYTKKADSDESELTTTLKFEYDNGLLVRINRFDKENVNVGYTAFAYDASNRIKEMEEKNYDQLTLATVNYNQPNGSSININYRFSNGNTMAYTIKYSDMNIIEDAAQGTGSETGKYQFDDKINPFYFQNFPDLFLSRTSKNNLIAEEKNYGGNIPSLEVYKREYIYDELGYPAILTKSYRAYTSKQHTGTDFIDYMYY